MLMLRKLAWCDYWTIASMDSPKRGASETNKFQNTIEAASILDPFEIVFQEAVLKLNKIGISGMTLETASSVIKPCYQALRNGLAFDWVVNSCVGILVEHYPFSPHIEYPGTQGFVEQFKDDPVFAAEVESLHRSVLTVLDWVFEYYEDRSVYKRLSAYAGTTSLSEAYEYLLNNPPKEPFAIPLFTAERINYAVLLMEMLSLCVGSFKRPTWTDRIQKVKDSAPTHADMALIVGSSSQAFVFGDITDCGTASWTRLPKGIQVYALNTRVDRTDIVRVVPDEMTFFRFTDGALFIDESLVPSVQLDLPSGTTLWIDPRAFNTLSGLVLDTPIKMRVKYDFPQDHSSPKTIALKGNIGTVVKDSTIVLDAKGIGETQVVFRNNVIGFKISDPEKLYPFTFFTSSNVENPDNFGWLD